MTAVLDRCVRVALIPGIYTPTEVLETTGMTTMTLIIAHIAWVLDYRSETGTLPRKT